MTTSHRFWRRLALFIAPFALAFALLSGVLIYTGESMPLTWVITAQADDPDLLYRPRHAPRDILYKVTAANTTRAPVVGLGSSRILQFRAHFFRDTADFYNAAGPGWTLDEVAHVYDALDDAPRVVLLALDPPWFNASYAAPVIPEQQSDLQAIVSANTAVLRDALTGAAFDRPGWSMRGYVDRLSPTGPALGLRAIRDGHGFRGDGSEQYGDFLVAGWLDMTAARDTHLAWLRDGQEMYAVCPASSLDPDALTLLDGLLTRMAARGTRVVGFFPSYMPTLWAAMRADPRFACYGELPQVVGEMFAARGFALADYSDGAGLGTPDAEFFDGWHAGERSNALLLADLAARFPDALGAYVDADTLRARAESAPDVWRLSPSAIMP